MILCGVYVGQTSLVKCATTETLIKLYKVTAVLIMLCDGEPWILKK